MKVNKKNLFSTNEKEKMLFPIVMSYVIHLFPLLLNILFFSFFPEQI